MPQREGLLRVITPRQPGSPPTSAPEGNPEVSGAIPDIRALMSGIGGKLPVRQTWLEQLLVAIALNRSAITFCGGRLGLSEVISDEIIVAERGTAS